MRNKQHISETEEYHMVPVTLTSIVKIHLLKTAQPYDSPIGIIIIYTFQNSQTLEKLSSNPYGHLQQFV